MRKRILVAVASVVLAALILSLLPASPDAPDISTNPTNPTQTSPTTQPSGTTHPTTQPIDPGVVRLYSCDEGVRAVFAELATEYTALTGVEVVVLSQEADGCQATLQRYMESEDPPTVLCVHSQSQLTQWQDTLLDLNDTALAQALCNDGLGLRLDGKLLAIPAAVEGYGLLVNAELLGTQGALSRNDIFDLSSLSTAVQILKNNSVKAFPTPAATLQDAWFLLMGEELDDARVFLDLYIANGNKSGDAREQFQSGKAAFFLGGSWEYEALASVENSVFHVRNLDILPNFAAGAMQYVCSTAWCVNASARQEDIQSTISFLMWMVTAGEDTPAPVDQLEVLTPFADAAWYGNQLEKKLRGYMQTEAAVVQWKNAEAGDRLLLALTDYMAENTDENWETLRLAVDAVKAENGYNS